MLSNLSCVLYAAQPKPWSFLTDIFSITFLEKCISNLCTFIKTKSYSCLLSLFIWPFFNALLWRSKTFEISLLCLPFPLPFLLTSLSSLFYFSNCPFSFLFIGFCSSLHLPIDVPQHSILGSLLLFNLFFLQTIFHGFKLLHKFVRHKHFWHCVFAVLMTSRFTFLCWAVPNATPTSFV